MASRATAGGLALTTSSLHSRPCALIELGIILIVLMGWPFAAAEYLGGILIVLILALLFRLTLTLRLVRMAGQHP